MIWIASFPRSGNTFMRNLFYDVFGLESCSFPKERNHVKEKDYKITKTHNLPNDIPNFKKEDFVIYLVRDGRDSIVSNSHYRKNFLDPDSDFNENLKEGIIAPVSTHFGGWSKNIKDWSKYSDIIIRFDDLTSDPVKCLQQVAEKIDLPEPDYSKIKSFSELKNGTPQYGRGGKGVDKKKFANLFFHKGQVGAHKTEMPTHLKQLFWLFHGDVMKQLGYTVNGEIKEYTFQKKPLRRKRSLKSLTIQKYIKFIYFVKWFVYSILLKNKIKSIKKHLKLKLHLTR